MFKKDKKEEIEMSEEEPQKEIRQERIIPPQVRQPLPEIRSYLLVVNDGESQETIVVKDRNILLALSKFAKEYNDVCAEWLGLNISIEEIATLE